MEITQKAYAKINLTLDITGKRADGYHELRSVMQTIGLYDTVELGKAESGIRLEVVFEEGAERGFSQVPTDEKNIAYRAAQRLLEDAKSSGRIGGESTDASDSGQTDHEIRPGVEIRLTKRIPAAAGLAGGSTDAAAVLRGINELYGLGYTTERLCEIGAKLGADIPFCIVGGTALCEGIGDRMTKLSTPKGVHVLLAKPAINVSTPEAYRDFDSLPAEKVPAVDTDGMLMTLKKLANFEAFTDGAVIPDPSVHLTKHMGNVLATVTERRHALIVELREAMLSAGAAGSMMSGSGPSVFGLFDSEDAAQAALVKLQSKYPDVYMTVTEFV